MLLYAIRYFLIFRIPIEILRMECLPFLNGLAENVTEYGLADILGGLMTTGIRYGVGFLDDTPHTREDAEICAWMEVTNARVVVLKEAYYRGAHLSGTFEIADIDDPFDDSADGLRVEVKMYWYGRRLSTRWPKVTIALGRPEIIENYNGEVVWNVGDPALL